MIALDGGDNHANMNVMTWQSERNQMAVRRLQAAYARIPNHDIPIVEPCVYPDLITTRETLADMDLMLEHARGWMNSLSATDNDWTPVILGYCSVVMVPEAFGCEVVFQAGQSPWAKHAVSDINQVWSLIPRPPMETPTIRRHYEWLDYAQRKIGIDVPMWTLDVQCPFSVAAQIVEPEELLVACVNSPGAVHHLCRMITEYSIEFMEELYRRMEHPGYPGANFPCISDDIGVVLADDTPLIMLGPEMYREFALPYNNRISEAFGGVHIHSCGDYRRNLDTLLTMTNVRSIQLHAGPGEFPLPDNAQEDCAFNRARRQVTFFVDTNDVSRGDPYRGRYREHYSEYVIPRLRSGDMTGCILQSCGCRPNAGLDEVDAAIQWTREQLQE